MAIEMGAVKTVTVQPVVFRYQTRNKRTGNTVTRKVTSFRTPQELEELKAWLPRHGGELVSVGPAQEQQRCNVYF